MPQEWQQLSHPADALTGSVWTPNARRRDLPLQRCRRKRPLLLLRHLLCCCGQLKNAAAGAGHVERAFFLNHGPANQLVKQIAGDVGVEQIDRHHNGGAFMNADLGRGLGWLFGSWQR